MQAQRTSLGKEEEDFQRFETKIDDVVNILKAMNSNDKDTQTQGMQLADKFLGLDREYQSKLSREDFVVKFTQNRTVINKTNDADDSAASTDQLVFMQQIEHDADRRAKERKERESIAQNLRKLGNEAFRKKEYERAISMYSKAIDHVKDSPVLYNNRALTYIRIGLPKKAIIDADFVIQKLDEKNVRSWLYRAKSYYLLGELRDFEKSINEAKKNNPKDLNFIEQAVAEIVKDRKSDENEHSDA